MNLALVAAMTEDRVIGRGNGLPWHLPEDLRHFKRLTLGHPVIMGRRTWESVGTPLPGRHNIVVTRQEAWTDAGAERSASLEAALALADDGVPERIWVIGGGQLFGEAIDLADLLEVTELDVGVEGDTLAPDRTGWVTVATDPEDGWHTSGGGIRYRFLRLVRPPEHGTD